MLQPESIAVKDEDLADLDAFALKLLSPPPEGYGTELPYHKNRVRLLCMKTKNLKVFIPRTSYNTPHDFDL